MHTSFEGLASKLTALQTQVIHAANSTSEDAAIFNICRGFRTGTPSLFTVLLFPLLAVLFSYIIRGLFIRYRLTLPYTVPLVILGGVFGVAGCYLPLGELSESLRLWVSVDKPTILYYILFPPILFESAMYLDWWVVKHTIPHQFALSIILVFISAAIVAAFTTYVFGTAGWSFDAGWLFGALISPTDALAVALTLSQTPVRKHIQVMIQGEALFNDGSGFTLFIVFLSRLMPNPNLSFGYLVEQFFRLAGGGFLIGIAMGIPTLLLLRLVWRDAAIEIGSTLVMAYLVFYVADGPCGCSGIVAVSVFGVMFSADRIASITPAFQESLDAFWEAISHIINSIAFVYAGFISVVNLIVFWGKSGVNAAAIGYGVALYPVTYLCRVVAVVALFPILRTGRYGASWREAILIVHCGLRGAISLIAAQIVFHTPSIRGSTVVSARVQLWTSMIVLLTLLFQGTTVRQVAAWLGLLSQSAAEVRLFRLQVRRLHRQAKEALREMQKHSRFVHANWGFVEEAAILPYKLDELLLSAGRVRARIRHLAARYTKAAAGNDPPASLNGEQAPGSGVAPPGQATPPTGPREPDCASRSPESSSLDPGDDANSGTTSSSAPVPWSNAEAIWKARLRQPDAAGTPAPDKTATGASRVSSLPPGPVPDTGNPARAIRTPEPEPLPEESLPSLAHWLTRFPLERKLGDSPAFSRLLVESRRRTLLAVRANVQKQHLIGSISRVTYRLLDSVTDYVNDKVCLAPHTGTLRLCEGSQKAGWGLRRYERLAIHVLGRVRFLDRLALALLHRRLFVGYDVLSGLAVALAQAWRSRYSECMRALHSLLRHEKSEPHPRAVLLLTMILHANAQVLQELEHDLQRCEQHLRSMRILSLETVRSVESLRAAAVMLSRQERLLEIMYAEGLLTKREFRGLLDQIDMRREALQRVSVRFPAPSFEKRIEAGIRRWFQPAAPMFHETQSPGSKPVLATTSSSAGDTPKTTTTTTTTTGASFAPAGATSVQTSAPAAAATAATGATTSTSITERLLDGGLNSASAQAYRLYVAFRQAGHVRSLLLGERLQASFQLPDAVILVAHGVLELRWYWSRTQHIASGRARLPLGFGRPRTAVSYPPQQRQAPETHSRRHSQQRRSAHRGPAPHLVLSEPDLEAAQPTSALPAVSPVCTRCRDTAPCHVHEEQQSTCTEATTCLLSPSGTAIDMPMTQAIARLISRDQPQAEEALRATSERLAVAAATFTGELATDSATGVLVAKAPAADAARQVPDGAPATSGPRRWWQQQQQQQEQQQHHQKQRWWRRRWPWWERLRGRRRQSSQGDGEQRDAQQKQLPARLFEPASRDAEHAVPGTSSEALTVAPHDWISGDGKDASGVTDGKGEGAACRRADAMRSNRTWTNNNNISRNNRNHCGDHRNTGAHQSRSNTARCATGTRPSAMRPGTDLVEWDDDEGEDALEGEALETESAVLDATPGALLVASSWSAAAPEQERLTLATSPSQCTAAEGLLPLPEYEVVSLLRHDDPLRNVHGVGGVLFAHRYPYELVVASPVANVLLIPRQAFQQLVSSERGWWQEALRLGAAELVDALIPGLETFFSELYQIAVTEDGNGNSLHALQRPHSEHMAESVTCPELSLQNAAFTESEQRAAALVTMTTTAAAGIPSKSAGGNAAIATTPLAASGVPLDTRAPTRPEPTTPATTTLVDRQPLVLGERPETGASTEAGSHSAAARPTRRPLLPPRQDSFTMYDYLQRSDQAAPWWLDASRSTDDRANLRYQVYVTGALAWYGLYERVYHVHEGICAVNVPLLEPATPSLILILLTGTLEIRPTSAYGAQILQDAFVPETGSDTPAEPWLQRYRASLMPTASSQTGTGVERGSASPAAEGEHESAVTGEADVQPAGGIRSADASRRVDTRPRRWLLLPDGMPPAKLLVLRGAAIPSLLQFLSNHEKASVASVALHQANDATLPQQRLRPGSTSSDGNGSTGTGKITDSGGNRSSLSGDAPSPLSEWQTWAGRVSAPAVLRLDHFAASCARPFEDVALFAAAASDRNDAVASAVSKTATSPCFLWMDLNQPLLQKERKRLVQSALRLQRLAAARERVSSRRGRGAQRLSTTTAPMSDTSRISKPSEVDQPGNTVPADIMCAGTDALHPTCSDGSSGERFIGQAAGESGTRPGLLRSWTLPSGMVSLSETFPSESADRERSEQTRGHAGSIAGPWMRQFEQKHRTETETETELEQQLWRHRHTRPPRRSRSELVDILANYSEEVANPVEDTGLQLLFEESATGTPVVYRGGSTGQAPPWQTGDLRETHRSVSDTVLEGSSSFLSAEQDAGSIPAVTDPASEVLESNTPDRRQLERDAELMAREHMF